MDLLRAWLKFSCHGVILQKVRSHKEIANENKIRFEE